MRLPQVPHTNKAKTFIQEFLGYNHNLRTDMGEFYETKNVSLDNYPVISTRQGFNARYLEFQDFLEEGAPHGLFEYKENTLMAVFGKTLHVNITADSDGNIVSNSTSLLKDSDKTFAVMGNKVLIMPDKVIYEFKQDGRGKLYTVEQWYQYKIYGAGARFLMMRTLPCDIGGYTHPVVESDPDDIEWEPPSPYEGLYWYKGSAMGNKWLEYKSGSWVAVEKPYTLLIPVLSTDSNKYSAWGNASEEAIEDIQAVYDFFENLKVLDTITLTMCTMSAGSLDYFTPAEYVIYGKRTIEMNSDWGTSMDLYPLVIAGMPTTNLVLFRIGVKCPELKHIFSQNNRIWGVTPRTILDEDDEEVEQPQEIFACKLGDMTQWYNYAGTAADSFAVSLGHDNEVTAGCSFNSSPHFFTEDMIIKLYGDYPSNYQLRTYKADGVVSGGHHSLVQLEGVLMWVSPIGVVMYDGSQPYFRGEKFSPNFLTGKTVVAGKDGTKYVLCVVDGNGAVNGVYAYDTKTGLWVNFANKKMIRTAEMKNALCFVDDQKRLVTLYQRDKETDSVPGVGENLLSHIPIMSPAYEFVINYDEYFSSMAVSSEGQIYFEETQGLTNIEWAWNYIDIYAETDYWNDPDNPYKNLHAGAGFPVPVEEGKKYKVYFTDSGSTEYIGGLVYAIALDHDLNTLEINGSKRLRIYRETVLTMPEGAETLIILFAQNHVLYPDYVRYEHIDVHEIDINEEDDIEWSLETGNLGLDSPNQKYISRIQLRVDFVGSLKIEISYDDSAYKTVSDTSSDHLHSITVPIKVRRNDHFKIRMSGVGQMKLYSYGYETDEGGARCLI